MKSYISSNIIKRIKKLSFLNSYKFNNLDMFYIVFTKVFC